mgnify:FL=1
MFWRNTNTQKTNYLYLIYILLFTSVHAEKMPRQINFQEVCSVWTENLNTRHVAN